MCVCGFHAISFAWITNRFVRQCVGKYKCEMILNWAICCIENVVPKTVLRVEKKMDFNRCYGQHLFRIYVMEWNWSSFFILILFFFFRFHLHLNGIALKSFHHYNLHYFSALSLKLKRKEERNYLRCTTFALQTNGSNVMKIKNGWKFSLLQREFFYYFSQFFPVIFNITFFFSRYFFILCFAWLCWQFSLILPWDCYTNDVKFFFFTSFSVRPSISSRMKNSNENHTKKTTTTFFLIQFTNRECVVSFWMRLYK